MSARNVWLAAGIMACLFARSSFAEDLATPSRNVQIFASPSILAKGTQCRITMHPHSINDSGMSVRTYEGTIKQATKTHVLLTAATIEERFTNTSFYTQIPYLRRYFKTTGIARSPIEEPEVQLPIEKMAFITLIEAVKTESK